MKKDNSLKSTNINASYSYSFRAMHSSRFFSITGYVWIDPPNSQVVNPYLDITYPNEYISDAVGYVGCFCYPLHNENNYMNIGSITLYPEYIEFKISITLWLKRTWEIVSFGNIFRYR